MTANDAAKVIQATLAPAYAAQAERVDIGVTDSARVFGYVVSPRFAGVDPVDRQQQVWDLLAPVPVDAKAFITMILALTPDELSEDDAA